MNTGTKIRTVLAIAVSIHTALAATDVTGFNNPKLDLIYKIASIIVNFIVIALNTYFNNDYTEEGAAGTALTRQLKAEKQVDYIGDFYYVDDEPVSREGFKKALNEEEPVIDVIEEEGEDEQ